jgi:hypothetical protein
MVAISNERSLSELLQEARQRAARLRCEAFVEYTPEVCGLRLKPVTLDSFNALDAFGNAFFHGGAIKFEDIANFVWLHHPDFGQFNLEEKARVTCAVYRYLNPRFWRLNELVWFASTLPRFRWMRHFRRPRAADRQSETVEEIRRLMLEAMSDMPAGDDDDHDERSSEPMPFSFQAFILNTFKRHLGLSFAETRALPMRQLAEHYRELLHHRSNGKALLLTREECKIWAEDLLRKNEAHKAELAAEAAKKNTPVKSNG